jgi:hypothetical protein
MDQFGTMRASRDGVRPDCKACQYASIDKAAHRARGKKWVNQNREKQRQSQADWRARNPEVVKLRSRSAYRSNAQYYTAKNKKWQLENREKMRAYGRDWTKRNLKSCVAKNAARRAALIRAIPPWADLAAIARFYDACPPGFHVDHVVPLRGKTVSGLHVLENLQYLPALENIRKGAKYG